jgi:hypothetical protein
MRKSLLDYQNKKTQRNFLTKRERLMKTNWKHGILGVDSPDTPQNGVYKQLSNEKLSKLVVKERRAKVRQAILLDNSSSFVSPLPYF